MNNPKMSLYAELLTEARKSTLQASANVPEKNRLLQLAPGRPTPLWLIGHLANTVNTIVLMWILGKPSMVPRELGRIFAPDFAGGTPPSTDASLYPAWDDVVALYDKVLGEAVAEIAKLDDAILPNPLPDKVPEPLRAFFTSNAVTFNRMVSHDAYHRGQIGMLSKLG